MILSPLSDDFPKMGRILLSVPFSKLCQQFMALSKPPAPPIRAWRNEMNGGR